MPHANAAQRRRFGAIFAGLAMMVAAIAMPAPAAAQSEPNIQMMIDLLMLDAYPRTPGNFMATPTPDALRNTSIAFLVNNTREPLASLQSRDTQGLVDGLNHYIHLMLRGVPPGTIRGMTIDDMRNTAIVIVSKRRFQPVWQLQGWNANGILQADKFPFGHFNVLYQNELVSTPPQLLVSDSQGACGQYENARARAGALPAELQSLKNSVGPIVNEIGRILDRIRSVPGLSFIIKRMIATNPELNQKMALLESVRSRIAAMEAEELRVKAILNDPTIVARCQACQNERPAQVADREGARPYGSFLHYVQDMRSRALAAGGTPTDPSQTAYSPTSDVYLKSIDEPDATLIPAWTYMRSVWFHRNTPVPQCS